MLTNNDKQLDFFDINIDNFVPQDHLVRKLDKAINWNTIRDILSHYYSDKGRPAIDPVVLIKMVIINYVFGIHSMRKTEQEIQVNLAYRWFLGLSLQDKVPDHSTFAKNYQRRFANTNVFDDIFNYILSECIKNDFVKLSNVYIDSTHIKAHANKNKSKEVTIKLDTLKYREELENEINLVRKEYNQKPLNFKDEVKEKEIKVSLNDEECGLFYKNEREKSFAYTASTACDDNGFVLATYVDAGNKHDSRTFYEIYNKVNEMFEDDIENVIVDAGYKTPAIAKKIIDNNQKPLMPYKRPMTKKGYMRKSEYVYDSYYDCYICPNESLLEYNTTNKDGYKIYQANERDCGKCQMKENCTIMKAKIVTRHIWEDYLDIVEELRHDLDNREIYKQRSKTIERVFADLKERHNHRYTRYKGKEKVQNDMNLVFACMNLKKLANWLSKNEKYTDRSVDLVANIDEMLLLIEGYY